MAEHVRAIFEYHRSHRCCDAPAEAFAPARGTPPLLPEEDYVDAWTTEGCFSEEVKAAMRELLSPAAMAVRLQDLREELWTEPGDGTLREWWADRAFPQDANAVEVWLRMASCHYRLMCAQRDMVRMLGAVVDAVPRGEGRNVVDAVAFLETYCSIHYWRQGCWLQPYDEICSLTSMMQLVVRGDTTRAWELARGFWGCFMENWYRMMVEERYAPGNLV